MALKTKVKRENVVSEEDGNVEWITDTGSMMKAPAKSVEIIEAAPQAEAAADQANTEEQAAQAEEEGADESAPEPAPEVKPTAKPKKEKAPPKAKQVAKAPAKPAKAATPAPAKPEPQPPQAAKPAKPETKEKTVATAKAKKKSTAKGARTIGGKEVDLSKYNKVKAPGGGVSYNNGDATAKKLEGKSLDDVYKIVARDTKQDEKELRKKYAHLNPGMQRMSLGNMHRKGPRDAKKEKKAA